jgi:3-oxoacyl-[acyl-carrier protein] reductase
MISEKIRGRMVILSSYVIREPQPNIALSSVCRIVTASLVRVLARDLGPKGIRVNGILPGYIMTKRIEELSQDAAKRRGISPEQWIADIVKGIPVGRMGSTEELANVIVFLASELSSYVSGALMPVDGAILRSVG